MWTAFPALQRAAFQQVALWHPCCLLVSRVCQQRLASSGCSLGTQLLRSLAFRMSLQRHATPLVYAFRWERLGCCFLNLSSWLTAGLFLLHRYGLARVPPPTCSIEVTLAHPHPVLPVAQLRQIAVFRGLLGSLSRLLPQTLLSSCFPSPVPARVPLCSGLRAWITASWFSCSLPPGIAVELFTCMCCS